MPSNFIELISLLSPPSPSSPHLFIHSSIHYNSSFNWYCDVHLVFELPLKWNLHRRIYRWRSAESKTFFLFWTGPPQRLSPRDRYYRRPLRRTSFCTMTLSIYPATAICCRHDWHLPSGMTKGRNHLLEEIRIEVRHHLMSHYANKIHIRKEKWHMWPNLINKRVRNFEINMCVCSTATEWINKPPIFILLPQYCSWKNKT